MQTEAVNGILPLVFKGVELRGCTKRVLLNNAIRTECRMWNYTFFFFYCLSCELHGTASSGCQSKATRLGTRYNELCLDSR